MKPNTWYKFRLALICGIFFYVAYNNLHASWIGLHPPEIDMLREDIFEEYRKMQSEEAQMEEEKRKYEEEERKRKEREEIYRYRDKNEYLWVYGDNKIA